MSGIIEKIKVKVGDKVSKGDLILSVAGSSEKYSSSKTIPKDTENLIKEAEKSLEKKQEQTIHTNNSDRKKPEMIQVVNDGDIDPLETNEWLESLTAVICLLYTSPSPRDS